MHSRPVYLCVLILTAPFAASQVAFAQVDSHEIQFRSSPTDAPDPFNPTAASNTLTSLLKAHVALLLDATLLSTNRRYYERTVWTITSGATTVRTLELETQIVPPLDVPPTRTFVDVDHAPLWNGLDTGGSQVADGTYGYTARGRLIRRADLIPSGTEEAVIAETAAVSGSLTIDTVNPVATITFPANNGFTSRTPLFSISLSDAAPSSGINNGTLIVTLDAVDISSSFTISGGAATYQVPTSSQLSIGSHTLTAKVRDNTNNLSTTATASFTTDVTPPQITLVQPPQGASVTATPYYEVTYSDSQSGVDTTTFEGLVDGVDLGGSFAKTATTATYQTPAGSPLSLGDHTFQARVKDVVGNQVSTATVAFRVVPPITAPTGKIVGRILIGDPCNPQPLAGATVAVLRQASTAVTDAQGRFVLTAAGGLNWLEIDKIGYLSVQRSARVVVGQDTAFPDLYLVPAAPTSTHIVATVGGTVTDPTGKASLILPAGSLPQDLDISLTLITSPNAFQGPPLTGFIPGGSVRILPGGYTLNTTATIRINNDLQVPQTPLTAYTWNAQTQIWDSVADAGVTPGGQHLEYKITHFSCPSGRAPSGSLSGGSVGSHVAKCSGSCCEVGPADKTPRNIDDG